VRVDPASPPSPIERGERGFVFEWRRVDRRDGLKCKSAELLYCGLIYLFVRGLNENKTPAATDVPTYGRIAALLIEIRLGI
jgi:hypothetical protein